MRRLPFIIILFSLILELGSCTNYRDDNGDLGGMWQMTSWFTRSSSGNIDSLVANNYTGIYYSINRRIIQYTYTSDKVTEYGTRIFGQFRHTPDSLFLYNFTYSAPYDTVPSQSVLRRYGINETGAYRIHTLTKSRMILTDPDNILTFRKY